MKNERLLYKDEFGYIHTAYENDGKYIGDKDVKNKLFNYEQEEADGKLMHLPCKVGATVYYLNLLMGDKNTIVIEKSVVKQIYIKSYGVFLKISSYLSLNAAGFGKTVFLTKEEAEKALEECEQ